MKRSAVLTVLFVAGCAGSPKGNGDADARGADGDATWLGGDAGNAGDGGDDVLSSDAGSTDVVPTDGSSVDVVPIDASDVDVVQTDTTGADTRLPDTGMRPDTGLPDAGNADTGGSTACTAFSIVVTAPTSGQSIETCTKAGMRVFHAFTASITGGMPTRVDFNWKINSSGAYAPPPFSTAFAAPANVTVSGATYSVQRQVGGNWNPTAGDFEPLASIGIGEWTFEVKAYGQNNCTKVVSQPFVLTFENRASQCPNP